MNQSLLNNARLSSRSLSVFAGCALSALGGVMGGCDQRSPTSVAVQKASTDVQVLTGKGGAAAESADHVKTLTKVASDTQGVAKEGSEGEQAAASLLLSTAQHGLAQEPMDKAGALDLGARNTITRINAFAGEWSATSGSAAAAEGFDPAAQISELGALTERKQREIATLQSELTKVQGRVEALRAQAKTKLDAAAAKHATYTEMTSDAVKLSAAEAAKIVARANVLRREGDALRLDGSKIEAEADSIAPTIGEIRAKIDEYSNQSKDFEAAQTDLKARAANFRAQAEAARTAATVAANQLDTLVGDLEKLYEGDLKQSFDDAISGYSKARGSASSGQNAAPGFGKLAAGEAMLFTADAQWAKSQSFGNFASTLDGLARVTPPLPQAAKYTEAAGKYRQVQAEALKEASASFEGAAAAFGSARVNGPVKERLERLGVLIEKAKTATGDSTSDVAAAFGLTKRTQDRKKPAEGGTNEGAAAIPVDPELVTALGAFIDAMKKGEQPSAELITGPEGLVKMVIASSNLDRAMKAKFNSSLEEAMGAMGGNSISTKQFENLSPADAKITMTSAESAKVDFEGLPPTPFKKVDGAWKMDVAGLLGDQAAMVGAMAGPLTGIFDEIAKDVEAGKFASADEVGPAIQQKMMSMLGPK